MTVSQQQQQPPQRNGGKRGVSGAPNAASVVAAASVRKCAGRVSRMRLGRNVECALYASFLLVAKKLVARAADEAKAQGQQRVLPEHVIQAANSIL